MRLGSRQHHGFVQRTQQRDIGVIRDGLRPVSRGTVSTHAHPYRLLLAHGDAEHQLAGRKNALSSKAALVKYVLGVDVGKVILDHPADSVTSIGFLIRS